MEINKKNSKLWSKLGPRATYGLAMLDLVERNSNVFALSADLGGSSGLQRLMNLHPDRYINTGIAEQNLIGISAGMAKENLIPFASSFAPFITHRCADQIRMNMGYMCLNIKTVGLGSGISMSILGNSHYGNDDLSFLRSIPNLTILSPCDCSELVMCIDAAAEYSGPVYIRMTGEPGMPKIYDENFGYKIGKANVLKEGSDILIIATGSMVYYALEAANELAVSGVSCSVVDMHTIKPLDTAIIDRYSSTAKLIVTVEEHNIVGGLGSAVCQYIATHKNMPKVVNIGLPDEYLKAGSYSFMVEKYGLSSNDIAKKIQSNL